MKNFSYFRSFKLPVKIAISLFFSILLMVFIIGELGLRIKHFITEKNNINPINKSQDLNEEKIILNSYKNIKYDYVPYLLWRTAPNQKTKVFSTNELGFRGDEWIIDKKDHVFRIIILGGSAAWGYGASSDEKTIAGFLEADLNKKLATIPNNNLIAEVYNAGEAGYVSSQEYILWREILTYKPDLVIHFNGYNDIYTGFLGKKAGWNHPFFLDEFDKKENLNIFNRLLNAVEKQSYFYRSIKFHLFGPTPTSFTDLSTIRDIYLSNMRLVAKIAREDDIPLIITLQPCLFTTLKELADVEKKLLSYYGSMKPKTAEYYQKGYQLLKEGLIKEMKRNRQVIFVDGSYFFNGYDKVLFFDPSHYIDKGNESIAEKLTPIIMEKIMEKMINK